MLTLKRSATRRTQRQRGLSIVELMVGVAVGLFVVAAATMLVATHLADSRRLTLETQVQQDLRAAADIVTRELRRAGHWARAREGVGQPGTVNAYRAVLKDDGSAFADGETSTGVQFGYARSGIETADNNALDSAEQLGFRLDNGVIQTHLGDAGWQALTDSATLNVTAFTLTMRAQPVPLECAKPCPGGGTACYPQLVVRDITVDITGQAAHDSSVQRRLTSDVRLRNDAVIAGSCPA
ncbi:MAG TPA: prepilin-type N-terminal cleavage/methylation domain-containing protein [Rubrivivax sp.]|nr:prepilin-type N-terminal cleavage/methylation domain-containing protein [Rubrivivax sp.]